ncbi:MAG TPA: L,D-transpeptidase [Solirubrobacteraceae bacterium]|nr:L,D-transpeptidase [Solirubrobacteraceae bacterium]
MLAPPPQPAPPPQLPQPAHVATAPVATVPGHMPAASPAPTPTAPTPTATPTPAAPAPGGGVPSGKLELTLQHVGGKPLFALLGQRIVVRGVVSPYVAGQQVQVSFYRDGRRVLVKGASITAVGNGAGQFHVSFASADGGLVEARAAHPATAAQGSFSGVSAKVRYVSDAIGPGAAGQSVRLLQSELAGLHYAVPLSGVFEEGTGRALIAYRKMTNLARVGLAGRQVFAKLALGEGDFRVRYRSDGRHVEADLDKQVLAEIEPGGRVHAIYTISSGKPSTPTVLGRFRVYLKTPGTNSEGMVDANYFIRGYAIHGYAEVPTYAASHGCLRVPIPDAPAIYGWVRTGTPVDVYN